MIATVAMIVDVTLKSEKRMVANWAREGGKDLLEGGYSIFFNLNPGNSIITTTCSFEINFQRKAIKSTYFCMVRESKTAPLTVIIGFPDEQIDQRHKKMLSSQLSN